MSDGNNIERILRQLMGRLEDSESSSSTHSQRSGLPIGSPSFRTRQQCLETDLPGPSYCTTTQRRFYPYNQHAPSERNQIFRPSQSKRTRQAHPKAKKTEMWKHEFVCLSNIGQRRVPTPMEKVNLVHANLGPLFIELTLNGDAHRFHTELLQAYPKLENSGGYELLRGCDTNNKELVVIPPPVGGYTALFLKSVVSHAKIYVRPLQENLPMEPTTEENASVYNL